MINYDENNILLDTDSYKASHWLQYPEGTTAMYSYLESRGGQFTSTVFFGLQYYLKRYLSKPITKENVEEAAVFFAAHGLPFNKEGFMYIVNKHGGRLPIEIKAVPEGTVVPISNLLTSVESTDPECFWVVSYLETLLMRLWYPITVASLSWYCRQIILSGLNQTAEDPLGEIGFKLHDFGSRGVSSKESAGIGGAAHLVNFMGSDTVWGVALANQYYDHPMSGFSIPAAEHSTMTMQGPAGELAAFKRMLDNFAKPDSLVAVVSDSYDIYNAIDNYWGKQLRQRVIDSGATVVVRPDSGNPVEVVLECLRRLENAFGAQWNSKGYRVLNNVRVIQGDGCTIDSISQMCKAIIQEGFSISNVAFGMGGGLLQKVDRDTQKFAYKCSSATIDGKEVAVFKDPVTDPGKRSKKGKLDLVKSAGGSYRTVQLGEESYNSVIRTVFKNGEILEEDSLDVIRERATQAQQ
jgi:nicotinamide phosphoribosyltransferase